MANASENYTIGRWGGVFRTEYLSDQPVAKCPHCGRPLRPVRRWFGNTLIYEGPEECDCEGARKERERRMQAWEEKIQQRARKRIREAYIRDLIRKSRLGKRFRLRTFDTFDRNRQPKAYSVARAYAEHFAEHKAKGEGLLFLGPVGTGKTHLAAAIANYLLDRGVPVIFGTLATLFENLRASLYADGATEAEREEARRELYDVDLLVLDDLGKERLTPWAVEELYSLLNYRYENMLPVVITTNLSLAQLRERYDAERTQAGQAIVSRITEMCRVVIIKGDDYRLMMRKNGR